MIQDDGQVVLCDFSDAILRDITGASPSHKMTGSASYMSPEQTGRTNIEIDYCTDFYSLVIQFICFSHFLGSHVLSIIDW